MSEHEKDGSSPDSAKLTPRNAELDEPRDVDPEDRGHPESLPDVPNGNSGPASAAAAAKAHDHGHGHGHDAHDHGLAHTTPVPLLVGVLGALMVLTVITVAVTAVDLGAQGNLVVAMVIATIKAALVVMFFMHLVWDKKLHLILFLTSVLFLILFLSISVTDRGEYQPDIDYFQSTEPRT